MCRFLLQAEGRLDAQAGFVEVASFLCNSLFYDWALCQEAQNPRKPSPKDCCVRPFLWTNRLCKGAIGQMAGHFKEATILWRCKLCKDMLNIIWSGSIASPSWDDLGKEQS